MAVVAGVAAVARLVVAVASFVLQDWPLLPDEALYIGLAAHVAEGQGADAWYPGYGQALLRSTWPFTAPLALLFDVLWPSRLVGQLWAALWGVVVVVGTYRLARHVVSPRWASIAALVTALLPSQVLWSSLVLRESMVWVMLLGIALALADTVDATGWRLVRSAIAMVALLVALAFLRGQVAVIAGWALVLSAWIIPGHRVLRGLGAAAVAAFVPALVGLGIGGWGLISDSSGNLTRTRTYLSFEADSGVPQRDVLLDRHGRAVPCDRDASGGSAGATGTTIPGAPAIAGIEERRVRDTDGELVEVVCGPDDVLLVVDDSFGATISHVPEGIAANLLRPYPWEPHRGWLDRLAGWENLMWYVLYVLAVVGTVTTIRSMPALVFPLVASAGLVAAGVLTQGNVGTAFRHRGQVLWGLAVVAAAGAAWISDRRSAAS